MTIQIKKQKKFFKNNIKLHLILIILLPVISIILLNILLNLTFSEKLVNTIVNNDIFINNNNNIQVSSREIISNITSENNTINSNNSIKHNTASTDSASNLQQLYIVLGCAAGFVFLLVTIYLINKYGCSLCFSKAAASEPENVNQVNTNGTIPTFAGTNITEDIEKSTFNRSSNETSVLSSNRSSTPASLFFESKDNDS